MKQLQRQQAFESWFQSPLGRAVFRDQQDRVANLTQSLTGARQLVVGVSHDLPLAANSDFTQRMQTTPIWTSGLSDNVVVCRSEELPFPSESMDLVVVHHAQDFSGWPHQVVREASRVLRSCGYLVMVGFNALSYWGLCKLVSRDQKAPWCGRFMTRFRLEDWLNLLESEVEHAETGFFRPPLKNEQTLDRLRILEGREPAQRVMPGGAYYCLLAQKRVLAPTDRRRHWRPAKVLPLPAAGPVSARVPRPIIRRSANVRPFNRPGEPRS
ncbi:methyltransferase domain-containing protein [Tamilnaduibacter salinus]|uniref:methyltransferase domain-containing protein n=1 Tax=Tamilnaduibacter salinus TaxID=1484056 RepID=UPI001D17598E|nr:methyltransferase domain-containing protein [Tamilnaduibacter salinus]